jgi:TPR repeat protein
MSGNDKKCLFCKADFLDRTTDEEKVEDMMKRVEVNDAGAMCALALYYYRGQLGLLPDQEKAMQLYTRAVELGSSQAHFALGSIYDEGGDFKKAKVDYEAAAMAGHDDAIYNLGNMEMKSNKIDRALKHWMIAASAGNHKALRALITCLEIGHVGYVSRESIDSSLRAYNTSCTEMRSEARDAYIQFEMRRIERNNA